MSAASTVSGVSPAPWGVVVCSAVGRPTRGRKPRLGRSCRRRATAEPMSDSRPSRCLPYRYIGLRHHAMSRSATSADRRIGMLVTRRLPTRSSAVSSARAQTPLALGHPNNATSAPIYIQSIRPTRHCLKCFTFHSGKNCVICRWVALREPAGAGPRSRWDHRSDPSRFSAPSGPCPMRNPSRSRLSPSWPCFAHRSHHYQPVEWSFVNPAGISPAPTVSFEAPTATRS